MKYIYGIYDISEISDMYCIYDRPLHVFPDIDDKNTYSEIIHKEGLSKLEAKFPEQSENIIDENRNIMNILGMCHGYNIGYIYTNMSKKEKKRFLKYHGIDMSNDNDIMSDTQKIMNMVFKDTCQKISRLNECNREVVLDIYTSSIKKYLSPDIHKYFIFPEILLNRHIPHIKNIMDFLKSKLISQNKIKEYDLCLFMTENVDNYYLLVKHIDFNKLLKIPINDATIDLFSVLMITEEDTLYFLTTLQLKLENINKTKSTNIGETKKKYLSDLISELNK